MTNETTARQGSDEAYSCQDEPAGTEAQGADNARLLSGEQLAKYIGTSKKFVYKHVSSGRMPGVCRIGRLLRFDRNIIDKRLAAKNLLLEKQDVE
jgi:excisionase family DNA binding protein